MDQSSYAGAGGKIRRRPAPRAAAATPYDRPPAAATAAHRLASAAAAARAFQGPGGEGGGWVSRLVDPASRLISGGAARLFSTVFRKRLPLAPAPAPAPLDTRVPAPPGRDDERIEDLPESAHIGLTPVLKGELDKGKNPAGTSDDKALSEVEHLLMRKSFTRVEFDRLTDILRARTVESSLSTQVDYREDNNKTRTRIDGVGGSTSQGMAVDNSPAADDPIYGVSSPADLAKQYMSTYYSREPQSSSLRSRKFLGNKAEASNTGYDRRSGVPLVSESKKFGNENHVLPVNGYVTSGLRSRSAICRMSRSPFFKGPSSSIDMNVSPFSLSHASGRQVLKRRATDFENELGSTGPIRRIRQKSNMVSPFRDFRASPQQNFIPNRTIGSNFAKDSPPVQESPSSKRLLLGTGQFERIVGTHKNVEAGKSSCDNDPPVPPQSSKTAEKIFEHLNKIAPSPKEKQSGKQSVSGNPGQSMSKQTVWQDNGPNSLSDPSSSVQFQDIGGVNRPHDKSLNGPSLNKTKSTKDGSSKVLSSTFQDSGNKDIKSDHVAISSKPAIFGNSVSATVSQKPGFKMAVLEDSCGFDDDQETPVPSKNSSIETEVKTNEHKIDSKIKEQTVKPNTSDQKVKSNLLKEKLVSSPVGEQPITSSLKDVPSSGLFSLKDPEKKATPHAPADNNIAFTFPHVPPGDHPETTVSVLPLAYKDDKQTSASSLMFGLNPSRSSDLETSTTACLKSKGRLGESVTKPATLNNSDSERGNGKERAGDLQKPLAAPTLTPPVNFASTASTSASLSNGLLHSPSPKLSNDIHTDKPNISSVSSTTSTTFDVSSSSPPISSSFSALKTTLTPPLNFTSKASASPNLNNGLSPSPSPKLSNDIHTDKSNVGPVSSTTSTTFAVSSSSLPVSSSFPALKTTNFGSSTSSESTIPETKPASTISFGTVGTTETKSTCPEPASKTSSNLNTAPNFSFSSQITTLSSSPVMSTSSFSSTATTILPTSSVQAAATTQFTFSSSGNSVFGLNSPAQSTGVSTSVAGTTSQSSVASTIFGSKLQQPQATMLQPSQSSATQLFGSVPSSSGPGSVSFGAGGSSSGPGTLLFGAGTSSSGPGTVPFGTGVSSSGPGTLFGAGASSSGPGTLLFGAGASSSGPGTVSFGVTTSSGPGFATSPFGYGAATSGSGLAFSSPSSSGAPSVTVASRSIFSGSSSASSSAAFSNPFGSTSSPPSTFTFGQSASSASGFPSGAVSAPSLSSQAPQAVFGMPNVSTTFPMGSPGNDQMNVEDSMADDTNHAAPAQLPAPVFGSSPFGQPSSSPPAPLFGAPAVQPSGVFQFGGQQGSAQQNPSFPLAGSVSGNFALGSGGGSDKSSRRIIKAKRTQKKR